MVRFRQAAPFVGDVIMEDKSENVSSTQLLKVTLFCVDADEKEGTITYDIENTETHNSITAVVPVNCDASMIDFALLPDDGTTYVPYGESSVPYGENEVELDTADASDAITVEKPSLYDEETEIAPETAATLLVVDINTFNACVEDVMKRAKADMQDIVEKYYNEHPEELPE